MFVGNIPFGILLGSLGLFGEPRLELYMCHHVPNYLHKLITVLLNMADLEDLLDLLLLGVLPKLVPDLRTLLRK